MMSIAGVSITCCAFRGEAVAKLRAGRDRPAGTRRPPQIVAQRTRRVDETLEIVWRQRRPEQRRERRNAGASCVEIPRVLTVWKRPSPDPLHNPAKTGVNAHMASSEREKTRRARFDNPARAGRAIACGRAHDAIERDAIQSAKCAKIQLQRAEARYPSKIQSRPACFCFPARRARKWHGPQPAVSPQRVVSPVSSFRASSRQRTSRRIFSHQISSRRAS